MLYHNIKQKVRYALEHDYIQNIILSIIIINAITLGLETSSSLSPGLRLFLQAFDTAVVILFVIELMLKLWIYEWNFFRNGWNIFDFVVIMLSIIPVFGNISVLRAMRILRALRLFSMVPKFRLVIKGFFDALLGLFSVAGMLMLLLYVAAVLATKLYGTTFIDTFGSLQRSLFSMFQIMTLEGWPELVRPVMKIYPYAWIFFIPFIIITTFTVFNLLIGVIVNSMQKVHEDESEMIHDVEKKTVGEYHSLLQEIKKLNHEIVDLKKKLLESRGDQSSL